MGLDKVLKLRKASRAAFTRVVNQLDALMAAVEPDLRSIQVTYRLLEERAAALRELDSQVLEMLLDEDDVELDTEMAVAENYQAKFLEKKLAFESLQNANEDNASGVSKQNPRKFKLPKLEFRKFGGDLKEWLPFWSQFQKIDQDEDISPDDKFQYLVQATVVGTRAREIVESFPPSCENYPKAVACLKARFGREDLLVEVYVREVLKMIISAHQAKEVISLSSLYDKLESHLRALETLGVTTDTCSAMLFPLVESCLPAELLRTWHRRMNTSQGGEAKERLVSLMEFLRLEVEGEERISLAMTSLGLTQEASTSTGKKKHSSKLYMKEEVPTAAGLLSTAQMQNVKIKCVFCDKPHSGSDCFFAQKMDLTDKLKRLRKSGCCFSCLKPGHVAKQCRANLKCVVCGKGHVTVMCGEKKSKDSPNVLTDSSREVVMTNLMNNPKVFLQTLKVMLKSDTQEVCVRALIDTGSQKSYILKDTAERMGYMTLREEEVVHCLFGGVMTEHRRHRCFKIRLGSIDGSFSCNFDSLDQPVICGEIQPIGNGPWIDELKKRNIRLTDVGPTAEPIEVLLGADVAGRLLTGRREVLPGSLVAVETYLGWTLMGKAPQNGTVNSNLAVMATSLFIKDINISELWGLDLIGIQDPIETKTKEQAQLDTWEHFRQTVRVNEEGRYEVCLPWKENRCLLGRSWHLAERRLQSTTKRLKALNLYEKYNEVFKEWRAEGIIEAVPVVQEEGYYLPHRPVLKEASLTTKMRPVFDASAREAGSPSLNDCLEEGPNLIELIPTVLLRFREKRVGVSADIKKAFLQISVNPADRDYLRFLWWNDTSGEIEVLRHRRVVFGVRSSPFLLAAVMEHHVSTYQTQNTSEEATAKRLSGSFYVDNLASSLDSQEELISFMQESCAVMASGGFELRCWEHSGRGIIGNEINVLGLVWNCQEDVLSVNLNWCRSFAVEPLNKRIVLAVAQRVFDPVGFSCPTTLYAKLLLQRAWKRKMDWDSELDEDLKGCFLTWWRDLEVLRELKIPRWMGGGLRCSLHMFCDASADAYAAAVFLRAEGTESITVQLVQAKCRVAPLNKPTLPRLELLAACIGARLVQSVIEALKWNQVPVFLWSDSTTVLAWILRDEQWSVFVKNRVNEIRKLTNSFQWRHVPGKLNPADLPSRGCLPKQLLASYWWNGPDWLKEPMDSWPRRHWTYEEEAVASEKKKTQLCLNVLTKETEWLTRRFSKFEKMVRMLAWMYRFLNNCKTPKCKRNGELCVEELNFAENLVLRLVQEESFDGIGDKRLVSLNPYVDNGLIRLKTKLVLRQDTFDFRCPVVLTAEHIVVKRLIWDRHVAHCHAGVQLLMSLLREHYWILGGRRAIRSVISKCVRCRRFAGRRLNAAVAPLPEDRVKDASVFEICGIDLAGPLFLRGEEKAWICIFTCAVFRAVHLELIVSLSTGAFLQALRRFIARRGRPSTIYCDNGTNFRGAESSLRRLDMDLVFKYSSAQRIAWKFNPPGAPWWGGWWERLIRVIKQLLRRTLGRACLSYQELATVLCDCEAIVNARPLTYMSSDGSDLTPLSPSFFLQDVREVGVPDCDFLDAKALDRRMRFLQNLRLSLRRRFRQEYLGLLVHRGQKGGCLRDVKVGEVVLVGSDNANNLTWPLARVLEVIPGTDGVVRVVRLKTASGEYLRPIQRLYPLEVDEYDKTLRTLNTEPFKVPRIHAVEAPVAAEASSQIQTRSGRLVRAPKHYDL